ncbi:hypothetical protein NL108_007159 [Boleophthalmus pectinirostris]|nr:hypothetical protein NL108_007159 [Boleophthalmus pectinirostris]
MEKLTSNFKDASNINPDDEPQEQTIYSQVNVSQTKTTEEETIHYGELDFFTSSPKDVPSTEQEETVYSQVQVSKPAADTSGQVMDGFENLYANVKKN